MKFVWCLARTSRANASRANPPANERGQPFRRRLREFRPPLESSRRDIHAIVRASHPRWTDAGLSCWTRCENAGLSAWMAYKFIRPSFVAECDLNFHQTHMTFDVAGRRRKLARHEVSGQRHGKFRPEGTMEINLIWRSLFRFRRPFRTGFLLPRYQTLRFWLISGCAFGTIFGKCSSIYCLFCSWKFSQKTKNYSNQATNWRENVIATKRNSVGGSGSW